MKWKNYGAKQLRLTEHQIIRLPKLMEFTKSQQAILVDLMEGGIDKEQSEILTTLFDLKLNTKQRIIITAMYRDLKNNNTVWHLEPRLVRYILGYSLEVDHFVPESFKKTAYSELNKLEELGLILRRKVTVEEFNNLSGKNLPSGTEKACIAKLNYLGGLFAYAHGLANP